MSRLQMLVSNFLTAQVILATMAVDVKKYLSENLIYVKLFGCWSPKNKLKAKFYKAYCAFMYVTLIVLVPIGSILFFVTKENLTVTDITDNIYIVSELTAYIFRMWYWLKKETLIKETLNTLNDLALSQQHPDQEAILMDYAMKAQKLYRIFTSCCVGALFAWASVPFFSEKRILPLEVWYPFNTLDNTTVYVLVYLHIFLDVAGCTVLNISTATFVAGLMMHATAQLKILKDSFSKLDLFAKGLDEQHMGIAEKDHIVSGKITECVLHHEAIIKYVEKIESCFGMYTFAQFMAGSLIICTTAIDLSIISPTSFKFYWMFTYMICMLVELLNFCLFGNDLYYESLSLMDSVYSCNWYNYGPKSKKALMMLMERSKRPLRVRAAKLFDLSLETFTRILRGAYSLFAVLQHLIHTNANLQREFALDLKT